MIGLYLLTGGADAALYHDSALKEDGAEHARADNYYANEQAALTWEGKGAEILGLAGQAVSREEFVRLLDGEIPNPTTGETQDLSANAKGASRRPGYDMTISAPKSVSVVALVGGDERVIKAHTDANRVAMNWLEEHGAQIRVKDENGQNLAISTGNLLYATVQHETSRQDDPQLHNHNVVVAVTYDHDAKEWRSLTNDELFQIRTKADTIYKAELARNLREAGYEIVYRDNGMDFDIRGVEGLHLEQFSQRSQQMRTALLERGIDPGGASHQARQSAVLATRSRKTDSGRDYLKEIWSEKARESGLDIAGVISKAKAAGPQQLPEEHLAQEGVRKAVRHLSEREQTFNVSELEEQAIFFSRGAGLTAIKNAIDDAKENRSVVDREGQGAAKVTTSAAIANELTLQDSIQKGKGKGIAIVKDDEEFDRLLSSFEARKSGEVGKLFKLSREQVNAARNVLMHQDKFQGIQGDAGTGKTAALEFVQDVARLKNWETKGIATSTTGARELEKATGIPSQTVAAFLTERDDRIKMLQAELKQLEIDFAHSPGSLPKVKRVAKRDIHLKEEGVAPGRYVFDSKGGEVFKSSTGLWHPINTLGIKLQDAGQARVSDADQRRQHAETFADRFGAKAARATGVLQETVGRSMTSYEVVTVSEAKAARAEHREQNLQDRARLRSYLTKTAQVENLLATGNAEGKPFLLVMDESSMTGAKDSARISEIARDMGARVVLQGDTKQHGSVSAGRAFLQVQQGGINLSRIEETRRFDDATVQQKKAISEMKMSRFSAALSALDRTFANDLYGTAATRYIENRKELLSEGITDPKIGIVTITNEDRKQANNAVREKLRKEGLIRGPDHIKQHLDDPKLTEQQYRFVPSLAKADVTHMTALKDYRSLRIAKEEMLSIISYDTNQNRLLVQRENGEKLTIQPAQHTRFSYSRLEERSYAVGDSVEARANIGRLRDPDRVANGMRGIIEKVDSESASIRWNDGRTTRMSNQQLRYVDHAYAHTSHKEQGVTNHREIFLISETGGYWLNREASYVATSRAKGNTEIVTTEEAWTEALVKAGQETGKTTAVDIGQNLVTKPAKLQELDQVPTREKQQERTGPELGL